MWAQLSLSSFPTKGREALTICSFFTQQRYIPVFPPLVVSILGGVGVREGCTSLFQLTGAQFPQLMNNPNGCTQAATPLMPL